MNKLKVIFSSKLSISTVLILFSAGGVLLQNVFKIKPFCLECRELNCAFCEIEFNILIFVAWLMGLILLIKWIKETGFKKASSIKKTIVVLDILLLCFCLIFPCIFLVKMFLPYYPN